MEKVNFQQSNILFYVCAYILWNFLNSRFDIDNHGFVKSDVFLKRLGLSSEFNNENTDSVNTFNSALNAEENNGPGTSMSIPYANITGK